MFPLVPFVISLILSCDAKCVCELVDQPSCTGNATQTTTVALCPESSFIEPVIGPLTVLRFCAALADVGRMSAGCRNHVPEQVGAKNSSSLAEENSSSQ